MFLFHDFPRPHFLPSQGGLVKILITTFPFSAAVWGKGARRLGQRGGEGGEGEGGDGDAHHEADPQKDEEGQARPGGGGGGGGEDHGYRPLTPGR
jgi:hypothetical protein